MEKHLRVAAITAIICLSGKKSFITAVCFYRSAQAALKESIVLGRLLNTYVLALLAAIVLLSVHAREVSASIVLPEGEVFDLSSLDLSATSASGSTSSRVASEQPPSNPDEDSQSQLAESLIPSDSSTQGSSAGQGGGSSNSSTATALFNGAALIADHAAILGWLSSDGQILLPSPPGTGLLRPPCCC